MWLNFFRTPFIPMTLPESYTNLFTWEEQLRCLIKDVYDFVDFFNSEMDKLDLDVDFKIKQEVGSAKAELQEQINTIKNRADQVYNQLNAEMRALRRDVSGTATTLRAEMAMLRSDVITAIRQMETYVDNSVRTVYQKIEDTKAGLLLDLANAVNDLRFYTDNKVASEKMERIREDDQLRRLINNLQYKLPHIYNPCRGVIGSIGQSLADLYNYLGSNGLRIDQIEDESVPVNYFEDNNIKVEYVDLRMGADIDTAKSLSIWSPYSGKKERIDRVVYDMVDLINVNNKKVDVFADNDVKVEDIDNSYLDVWEMGINHWYDINPPKDYTDWTRDSYRQVFDDGKSTSQEPLTITTPKYNKFILQVLNTDNYETFYVECKSNSRVGINTTSLRGNATAVTDKQITWYRYVEVRVIRQFCEIRVDQGYKIDNGVKTDTNNIVIQKIWGVDSYNDVTKKED